MHEEATVRVNREMQKGLAGRRIVGGYEGRRKDAKRGKAGRESLVMRFGRQ